LRAYEEGRKRHGRLAIVFARPNGGAESRLGITVTKKLGGAVVRNLLKRRVREIYRTFDGIPPGVDVVVNLKREAIDAPFEALRADLARLLPRVERG
jgi:ribonuclease P protein component